MTYETINDSLTIAGNGEGTLLANRYRVVRQLGQGGMGSVWLAEDTQLDNKLFAIKMLPAILVANKRAYLQLKDEALVAMKLTHPNIVTLRAFEENNGNPFLVMDYIDGLTLDDYLAEKGKLSEDEVLRVLRPIAAALDYAHTKGVVHRDVKPGNVMIAKDGTPYILDFGIAREIQETMTRVTGKLSSGTLLYMSPEQLMGESPKPAQDIYSFAAMAYECLKGEPPFSHGQIEFQIMNKQPEPLAIPTGGLSARGSGTLAASVMAGLTKKPEARPVSCSAVLEGRASTRAEMGGPRHRAGLKPLLAVAALILVAVGGWLWLSGRENASRVSGATGTTRTTGTLGTTVTNAPPVSKDSPVPVVPPVPPPATNAFKAKPIPPNPGPTDADVVEIAVEASVQEVRINGIDGADGFKARKDKLAGDLQRATAYRKEKCWAEAAQGFTNYVNECRKLIALDKDRQTAKKCKADAEDAKNRASNAGAPQYAKQRWNAASTLLKGANELYDKMLFADATPRYATATKQFENCVGEANKERTRRAKWHKEGEPFTINNPYGFNMTMKWCPKGTFTMGSPSTEDGRYDNERQHEVTLTKGFWMGETEVTQGQWKKMMGGETVIDLARKALQDDTEYMIVGKKRTLRTFFNKSKYDDPQGICGDVSDDVPVYYVSWEDAVRYCRKLTEKDRAEGRLPDGYEYRLPTEAEWEYACRAGTTSALPNGKDIRILGENNAPALNDIAWYGGNSSFGFNGRGWDTSSWKEKQWPGGRAAPREVKGRQPNNWGLYDVIGNVWEWCGDWYGEYPYGSATDPTGAERGAFRVDRGGGWGRDARFCRSANRDGNEPGYRSNRLGFRVALAPSH